MKNKNRKSFMAVIQVDTKKRKPRASARIYRIKQNRPVFLDHVYFPHMFCTQAERDDFIIRGLLYNGHVLAGHSRGVDFNLEVV